MPASQFPASGLREALDENPVLRMQSRILDYKQKLTGDLFATLNVDEQKKAIELAAIPDPEERMDALLIWAGELNKALDKEQIVASTRGKVERRESDVSELKDRIQKLERETIVDSVTDAYNRHYLEEHVLPKTFERVKRSRIGLGRQEEDAERNRVEISLLFIDLDNFKRINDRLSHKIGDKALKTLCTILNDTLRDEDTFARWGGEEFIVILEGNTETAKIAAERIRKAIETRFKELLEPHCKKAEQKRILAEEIDGTASIGIASYGPEDEEMQPEDLIDMADAAMYRAKRENRNAVRVYDPEKDNEQLARSKETHT